MNSARKQTFILLLVVIATMLLSVVNAFAGPGRATYQAKIVKPDGYPLEASNVNFKFTILDPLGTCILFAETYSAVNMSSTGGLVSFSLGSGVKTYPVSSPTFEDVFSNITPNLSCDAGGPPNYSPASTDIRKIVMQFHDGSGWQTLPAMNINAVPYAMYATNAEKLGGVSATAFVQDAEIPTCPGGQALTYNGTMFSCITSGGGTVSAAAVVSALGYTPADSASLTTVTAYASNVSATVFSVSSTVSSLSTSVTSFQNSVAASFAAITSSQWVTSGTTISYNQGSVSVSGALRIGIDATTCTTDTAGTLRYNVGVVEYCNGTSWSPFGVAGSGITLLNGSASGTQTFGTGMTGTVFNITSVNGVHTFNIPLAASGGVTAGLISNADYSYITDALLQTAASFTAIISIQATNATSFAAITSTQVLNAASFATLNSGLATVSASLSATADSITSDLAAVSSSVAAANLNINNVSSTVSMLSNSTAASFAAITSSQWITSGTNIYYPSRVSVGTSSTLGTLAVGDGATSTQTVTLNGGAFAWYGWYLGGVRTAFIQSSASEYAIYSQTSGVPMTFSTSSNERMRISASGSVGVGINQPTALLNLAQGTSTRASFKLSSGTLLSSPQSGTIEYDGFNYYVTDSSNTRRTIATAGSNSSFASGNFAGNINSSGSIITSSNLTAPTIYGSSLPSGNLTIDSTSSATKGNIILAPTGGNVGVGTSNPAGTFHVAINNPATTMSTVSDSFVLQNKNATANALTSIMFVNQDGFGTGQIATLQNSGNNGSPLIFGTKISGGGSWNTSQLVLNTNNRVGIGTATPGAQLDIKIPNDTTPALYVGDSTTNGATGLYFSRWGSASAPMGIQGTVAGVGANALVLQAQAGNVGIGTTNPIELLHVEATTGGRMQVGTGNIFTSTGYGTSLESDTDDGVVYWNNHTQNSGGNAAAIIIRAGHGPNESTVSRTIITFKTDTGKVGIGTTNPGTRLHVATPVSAGINNRFLTGNSNSDLMDATGLSGDLYLDHIVSARLNATASTTISRAATLKIDTAPSVASSSITVNNAYSLWVESGNSVFGGNVGVGVTGTPSSYGHGGSNKILEIHNPNTGANAQAHLILTSGVSDISGSSLGTLTWAQPNVANARKEVAWISSVTESASGSVPMGNLGFSTRSASDATPVDRLRISSAGDVGIGTTTPQARLQVTKNLGGAGNGATLVKIEGTVSADNNYTLLDLYHGSANVFRVRGDGYIGIGVSQPATLLSNISSTANNVNVGDGNGTGQNSQSFSWGSSISGYAAAITNTGSAVSANGLQVRTLNTAANTTIFAAGIGVSSTANSNDYFVVKGNGHVGVNTTSPLRPFTVNATLALQPNTSDHIYMEFYARTATPSARSGWFGYGTAGTSLMQITNEITNGHINLMPTGTGKVGIGQISPSYMLDVNGTLRGYGITDSSDIRLKKEIVSLDLSLEKILQVQGVSYFWKDKEKSEKKQIGFIAQQLEKIFPELVETDEKGMKSVNYSHLVSPLVEAVKALYGRIINLEQNQNVQAREIATVKAENEELKRKNQELEKRLERIEKALAK